MEKLQFRMSEAGKCSRALWAQATGVQGIAKPSWLEEAAEEGMEHEIIIKKKLTKAGWVIEEGGICKKCPDQRRGIHVELVFDTFILIGHIDGKAAKDNQAHVLEVKSMSDFEYSRWNRGMWDEFPDYADQLTCYMNATKLFSALYCAKNRNNGHMVPFIQKGPPSNMDAIIKKHIGLVTMIQQNQIPDCEPDFGTFRCKRCSFKQLCIRPREDMVVQDEMILSKAAENWRKGDALVEEGERLIADAKAQFKEQSIASKQDSWIFSGLAIKLVHKKTETYQKKVLEQLFTPKQLAPSLKVSESEYVTVTDLDKKA